MRILGSTILTNKFGEKYKVTQTITGNTCTLAVEALTAQTGDIYRIKQVPATEGYCQLSLKEVE